ncbi:MAG: histidine triad nucleotide-binding protein [Anaerolineae bacterium]
MASPDCVFCRIVAGVDGVEALRRTPRLTAFHDRNPQAPVHVLIVPNRHIAGLNETTAGDASLLGEMLLLARQLAEELGVATSGYRLVLNSGRDGGQSVYHLHLHLLAGRALRWPPG